MISLDNLRAINYYKDMETPISKSQTRALAILGLTAGTYDAAKEVLTNAGYRGDAVPVGGSWRSAAKLNDSDLIAAIALDSSRFDDTSNDMFAGGVA